MDAVEKAQALAAIRQDLGGLGLGLVVGAIACYFVRPKAKATDPLQMAQRWLAWGLLASITSGMSFWFRNHDKGGILGAIITVVFFSALAWGLGYVWGRIKFARGATPREGQIDSAAATGPHKGVIAAGVVGLVILGLVALSAIKSETSKKKWWEEPGAVEAATKEERGAQAKNSLSDTDTPAELLRQLAGGSEAPNRSAPEVGSLVASADAGDADSQYFLALRYLFGNFDFLEARGPTSSSPWYVGVPRETPSLLQAKFDGRLAKDEMSQSLSLTGETATAVTRPATHDVAVDYLTKSAEQGHALAQFALYECYIAGIGVEPDDAQAKAWLRRACDQGQAEALLVEASLIPFDHQKERLEILTRAAEQGHAAAQYYAANCHMSAYYSYLEKELGAKFGKQKKNPFSFDESATMLTFDWKDDAFLRQEKALSATSPDVAAARKWYLASADQGYPPAQCEAYGILSQERANGGLAIEYLKSAAQVGYGSAMLNLAREYKTGEIVPKDEIAALAWAYLVKVHQQFSKRIGDDGDPELRAILKERDSEILAFEEGLSAESRIQAQALASSIQQSIEKMNSPWRNVSAVNFSGL